MEDGLYRQVEDILRVGNGNEDVSRVAGGSTVLMSYSLVRR